MALPAIGMLMVVPGLGTSMVRPGMVTSVVRTGMAILVWWGTAAAGRYGRCRDRQRTVAGMRMACGTGHIDGGPWADHHIGTVQAHYPVRDIGRGEKHRRC